MEGTRRSERRLNQLLDKLKQKRRCWNFNEETVRTFWRTRFGRCYGSVVRETMNKSCIIFHMEYNIKRE